MFKDYRKRRPVPRDPGEMYITVKIKEGNKTIFKINGTVGQGIKELNYFASRVLNLPVMDDLFREDVKNFNRKLRRTFRRRN